MTDTSYTYTNETTSGEKYSFKVRARSEVGYGPYSEPIEIIAATVPSAPDAPTTTLTTDEYNI